MITTETLVWAFFFAIIAAVVYAFAMQNFLSGLALKLTRTETDSEEKAKTLEQLGYKPFSAMLTAHFASSATTVARAIVKIGGEKSEKTDRELLFKEKVPVKYYLPEENITKNVKKHLNEKTSVVKLVVLLVILLFVAYIANGVISFLGNYAYGLIDREENVPIGIPGESHTSQLDKEEQDSVQEQPETENEDSVSETSEQETEQMADEFLGSAEQVEIEETDTASQLNQ
jgi:hypothetical protein